MSVFEKLGGLLKPKEKKPVSPPKAEYQPPAEVRFSQLQMHLEDAVREIKGEVIKNSGKPDAVLQSNVSTTFRESFQEFLDSNKNLPSKTKEDAQDRQTLTRDMIQCFIDTKVPLTIGVNLEMVYEELGQKVDTANGVNYEGGSKQDYLTAVAGRLKRDLNIVYKFLVDVQNGQKTLDSEAQAAIQNALMPNLNILIELIQQVPPADPALTEELLWRITDTINLLQIARIPLELKTPKIEDVKFKAKVNDYSSERAIEVDTFRVTGAEGGMVNINDYWYSLEDIVEQLAQFPPGYKGDFTLSMNSNLMGLQTITFSREQYNAIIRLAKDLDLADGIDWRDEEKIPQATTAVNPAYPDKGTPQPAPVANVPGANTDANPPQEVQPAVPVKRVSKEASPSPEQVEKREPVCVYKNVIRKEGRNESEPAGDQIAVGKAGAFLVDGMGGEADDYKFAGIATRAVKTILDTATKPRTDDEARALVLQVIRTAKNAVDTQIQANKLDKSAGGVFTLVVPMEGNKYAVANCGDASTFVRNRKTGEIRWISKEHTMVQLLRQRGLLQITDEEAFNHPDRNVVARDLSTCKATLPDNKILELAEFQVITLGPDEDIATCSDGITDNIPPGQFDQLSAQAAQNKVSHKDFIKTLDELSRKVMKDNSVSYAKNDDSSILGFSDELSAVAYSGAAEGNSVVDIKPWQPTQEAQAKRTQLSRLPRFNNRTGDPLRTPEQILAYIQEYYPATHIPKFDQATGTQLSPLDQVKKVFETHVFRIPLRSTEDGHALSDEEKISILQKKGLVVPEYDKRTGATLTAAQRLAKVAEEYQLN